MYAKISTKLLHFSKKYSTFAFEKNAYVRKNIERIWKLEEIFIFKNYYKAVITA